ncbi:MAG: SDR family oxidoreductase [Rhodobacterales bacterium]|nr:SDR family oxidoreductase [Rhodobacterales bacterium]
MTFSDLTRFDGKTAVVTGGVRGLGRAMADALAEQGADVHVFDWTDPTDEDKAGPLSFYKVDVSKSASVNEAVASLPNPATLLISNAGITRDTTIRKMDDDMWQAVIDVNLTGNFNLVRAMTPAMVEAGGGRIVLISSINGLRGMFGQANYASAKAGMIGLCKTVAREYGRKNVTCNVIAPGMVRTEMALKLPPEIIEANEKETAMAQLCLPEDVANAAVFLLSDAACRVTGQVLQVDAGQYL